MDLQAVTSALREQKIELPSWAFGNSGTRFKVFAQPGVPRDPYEKIADAAQVHKYTGVAPTIALHLPWDAVDNYASLAAAASEAGITLGTINANVFQYNDYKLGSVTNPDPAVRRKALDHLLECIDVMDQTGSRDLKLWFSDGTNYPGQDSISARQDRLAEALAAVYARLSGDQRLVPADKLFEPAFSAPDVGAWGKGGGGPRSPRPGDQHRVHRGVPAAGGQAGCLRLQLPVLRRRRPHGRRRCSVPPVPD